jgi:hypothetical protein
MYECTDGFEDSHTRTNVSVWISPGVSTLTGASGHVLCCSASSTLVHAESMALIVLRSFWPYGLEKLLAPPQALELVAAWTGKAVGCQYLCCELCMLNRYRDATRHGNKYFHNGEFPESSRSNQKFYNSSGCV